MDEFDAITRQNPAPLNEQLPTPFPLAAPSPKPAKNVSSSTLKLAEWLERRRINELVTTVETREREITRLRQELEAIQSGTIDAATLLERDQKELSAEHQQKQQYTAALTERAKQQQQQQPVIIPTEVISFFGYSFLPLFFLFLNYIYTDRSLINSISFHFHYWHYGRSWNRSS
jgi:hypothetical protein